MKILHITAEAFRGGCEKNCYHFIKEGSSFEHEVVVLGKPGPMSEDWESLNIKLTHLSILHLGLFSFGIQLRQFFKNGNRFDAIICWSTIRLPFQLKAIGDKAGRIRVHLGNPVSSSYRPIKDLLLGMAFPVSVEKVNLIACSRYVAESHKRTNYFNRFTIRVSLNPVSLPAQLHVKNPNSDLFQMGMVARLDPIKDHRTAIEAFSIVYKQIPEARLHLVGDGVMCDELRELVSELKIQEGVVFHGQVKDVYAHLNQWDVFIYSTTSQEGLGSAVEEAMANGLPCVLSDLPMLRELAPDENLVLWFKSQSSSELATQILLLYHSPELRRNLSKAAYQHALANFNASRFIHDYLS